MIRTPGQRVSRLRLVDSNTLRAEEGSHLCIVDVAAGPAGKHTRTLSVSVAPHATLTVVSIIPPEFSASVHFVQHGAVEAGGGIHWWNAVFGGMNVQHELISEVTGEGGESTINWLFLARAEQHYNLHVKNLFHAPHGKGEVAMKGVACGRARVGCHGAIVIGEDGDGTSTHLTQHILMLDASAKVDAVPALEIKTNDVKARHSATVTKVSADDLFYMGSRGISLEEARRLCVEGFLAALIDRLPVASLRDELYTMIHGSCEQSTIG
ncbi:hypothetical protein A3H22_02565 [Candidatus Peribacteria bacterium RIFCSPLOWO2_12_FULL_55_15]|nr:MAG: hypothetical protein A3D12_01215 [Candidatus Peribacteria bacterium RIFCSPHIGHO2_02_FULL_55_24]OGJ65110.1 MAG: hypothetical protein A3E47_02145 [Candidatus Peribacteria bacterium RIFCSPHIGHO2_12_FULL_54_10]OGJ67300.1 MAG: hypothetical protein A2947_01225 [Candidatus Peribacteria bacterium RIFCSPLOWO2_01_FULL_54_110]OGJ70543.1 MAG: hypothetical protein A3H22_02565 [Candidatus Peribacteria bacterium RIFCSPLOWO2_12_FULL_55_15]